MGAGACCVVGGMHLARAHLQHRRSLGARPEVVCADRSCGGPRDGDAFTQAHAAVLCPSCDDGASGRTGLGAHDPALGGGTSGG